MSDIQDPNKANLVIQSGLGVENIALNTNRLLIPHETAFHFTNAIAIPSFGILSDAALWLLGYASAFRIMLSAYLLGISVLAILILVSCFVAGNYFFYSVAISRGKILNHVGYRFFIIAIAFITAFKFAF